MITFLNVQALVPRIINDRLCLGPPLLNGSLLIEGLKVVVVALTHNLLEVLVRRSLPVRCLFQLIHKAHLTLLKIRDPRLVFRLLVGLRNLPDCVSTASVVLPHIEFVLELLLGVVVSNHVFQFLLFLFLYLLHTTLAFLGLLFLEVNFNPIFLLSVSTHEVVAIV